MVQLETQSTQTEQGKDAPIFDSATDEEFERFFAKSAIKTQRTTPTSIGTAEVLILVCCA